MRVCAFSFVQNTNVELSSLISRHMLSCRPVRQLFFVLFFCDENILFLIFNHLTLCTHARKHAHMHTPTHTQKHKLLCVCLCVCLLPVLVLRFVEVINGTTFPSLYFPEISVGFLLNPALCWTIFLCVLLRVNSDNHLVSCWRSIRKNVLTMLKWIRGLLQEIRTWWHQAFLRSRARTLSCGIFSFLSFLLLLFFFTSLTSSFFVPWLCVPLCSSYLTSSSICYVKEASKLVIIV